MAIPKSHTTDRIAPGKPLGKTRVLIVDEQPMLRQGISVYLNSQPDIVVCGEADCIQSARRKIAEGKPHLLVTALRLGNGDSLEFLKALKAEKPGLMILVYSGFEETTFAERAMRAGADGYVMTKAPKEDLLAAIHDIMNGGIYVSRDVAMRAFRKLLEMRPENRFSKPATGLESLSDREMHIFQLLGSGLGTREIAHSLNLSVKTIESHRENIKHKLGVNSSRDLVDRATRYLEETFLPPKKEALVSKRKKKSCAVLPGPMALTTNGRE
jgi:DNA-binding NarL/FixJ family response regulator